MTEDQIKRFFELAEKRDTQFEKLILALGNGFKDHDLLVRLDEKFNLFVSTEMEHRERVTNEIAIQRASVTKAHERLDDHKKETTDKFSDVLKFQYIATGAISLVVFLCSVLPTIYSIVRGHQ